MTTGPRAGRWNLGRERFDGRRVSHCVLIVALLGVSLAVIAPSSDASAVEQGTVVAWGGNAFGEQNVPTGLSGVATIAAGKWHALAAKADGTVVGWGYNSDGQATPPAGLDDVVAVAGGLFHSLALKTDGTIVGWGSNSDGQLNIPAGLGGVVAVSAGAFHSLALKGDGTVVAWGSNAAGQLNVPPALTGVIAIAAGEYHNLALKSDGSVVAWGQNDYGKAMVPAGLTGVTAIAAGPQTSLALRSDGTVAAWGNNNFGSTDVPAGLDHVVAIAAGSASYALKSDGTVAAWGYNGEGETDVPAGLTDVTAIAANQEFALALQGSAAAPNAPDAPTNVTVTPDDMQATVSWNAPASGDSPTGYKVMVTPSVDPPVTVGKDDRQAIVTGLTNCVSYTFTVRAFNAAGESNDSNSASTTPSKIVQVQVTDGAPQFPSDPQYYFSPKAVVVSSDQCARLKWTFSAGNARPHSVIEAATSQGGLGPSNTPLFNSGLVTSGGTFTSPLLQGATFYQYKSVNGKLDSNSPSLYGSLTMPVNVSPSNAPLGSTFAVKWAPAPMPGYTFTVQYQFRKATAKWPSTWTGWLKDQAANQAGFVPATVASKNGGGFYRFRAQIKNAATKTVGGWSWITDSVGVCPCEISVTP